MIVSRAQGHGSSWARSIRAWIVEFVREGTLPLHSYCYSWQTVLEDEAISQEIKEALTEKAKAGFLKAQDVCEIIASERIQTLFSRLDICKPSISQSTARRWLAKMKWRYDKMKNGMFIDGHERDDNVSYRQAFVDRWAEYEIHFQLWDDNGNPLPRRSNSSSLVLVTHDESTFFQNDERKTCWSHQDSRPTPKPKGEGQSLMVSDFLTTEWGRLRDGDRCGNSLFLATPSDNHSAERPGLCLKQERIAMDTSMRRNSLPKSIARSTSLRPRQTAARRASFCLTMHPVTRNVPLMPSLPGRWSKVSFLVFF
jgi:hypothetical protein